MATPSWPGPRSPWPAAASDSAKRAKGTWVSTPAPSPVRESAPTPPRWVRLTSPARARSTIRREDRPAISTTRPTPHESRSNDGSQSGATRSSERGAGCMMFTLRQVSTLSTRGAKAPVRAGREGAHRPPPGGNPDIHSSVEFERNRRSGTTQRPERLDVSFVIWAVRPMAAPEQRHNGRLAGNAPVS